MAFDVDRWEAGRNHVKEKLGPMLNTLSKMFEEKDSMKFNEKKVEEEKKVMNVHERKLEEDERNFEKSKKTSEIKYYEKTEEEKKQLTGKTAARFSEGKIRHDLIPPWIIDEIAKVYTYGTVKYNDDNWRKGLKWKKFVIGPLQRHLNKWLRGEKVDSESNCHHLAMVIWQCIALMLYEKYSIGEDDRNPYDLDMLSEEEQKKRIEKWVKLAIENKLEEYNGLDIK